jgi:ABC-2 type transport system ATP-binding protein
MIECNDLSKQFGEFWAVDGASFNVQPGQVLALLGQNGAGKTTTVRMLTAVLSPTRGWARIAGYDVATQPGKVRASVGVLTEQHGIYSRMTAVEYLDYFGRVYGLDANARKARSAHLLEYFGLTRAAKQRTGEYSKGMRQKLALARALIHEPLVLLLDEPTSAMDPESARLVRDHIASLRSSQRTIIICTHNLIEAEMLADQIAIIYQGRIQLTGTVAELRKQLMGPTEYEVVLSHAHPLEIDKFPQGARVTWQNPLGFRYEVATPEKTNPLLVQELAAQNAPVVSIQEVSHSLEQIYLKAMERVTGVKPL